MNSFFSFGYVKVISCNKEGKGVNSERNFPSPDCMLIIVFHCDRRTRR